MSCGRPKTIICDEIFDANFVPSEKDILDYAFKIGIDPTTEKHLLSIAKDGLMQPLPKDWKPCMVAETGNYYYFNSVTGESQWHHPLDGYYKDLVRKGRSEGYSSAGEDDSKTSIKEDLKSCEEVIDLSENMYSSKSQELSRHRSNMTDNVNLIKPKEIFSDRQKVLNPIGRPPLPPKRGSAQAHQISPVRGGTTSPTFPRRRNQSESVDNSASLSLRFSGPTSQPKSSPSPTRIDIDSMSLFGPSLVQSQPEPKTVPSIGLKIRGGGSMFLKTNQKRSPSPTKDSQPLPTTHSKSKLDLLKEPDSLDSPVSESILQSNKNDDDDYKKHVRENRTQSPSNDNVQLKSILRDSSPSNKLWDVDPCYLSSEEKMRLRNQELEEEKRRSVRFADFEKKTLDLDIRFHIPDSEETASSNSLDHQEYDYDVNSDEEKEKDVKINLNKDAVHDTENKIPVMKEEIDNRALYISMGKESGDSKELSSLQDHLNLLAGDNTIVGITNVEYCNNNIIEKVSKSRDKIKDDFIKSSKINNKNISKLNNNSSDNLNIEKSLEDCQNSEKVEASSTVRAHINRSSVIKSALDYLLKDSPTSKAEMLKDDDIYYKCPELKRSVSDNNAFNIDKLYDRSPRGAQSTSDSNEYLDKRNDNEKRKIKHMPEVDFNKVFENMREVLINSSEHSEVEDEINNVEMNEISKAMDNAKLVFEDSEDIPQHVQVSEESEDEDSADEVKTQRRIKSSVKEEIDALKKAKEMEEREIRIVEDEILKLKKEQEQKLSQILKEATDTESFHKERILKEMQNEIELTKVKIEKEKVEKEVKLRQEMEQQLKDCINQLDKEKIAKEKEIKEKHVKFLEEQEERVKAEQEKVEEERNAQVQASVNTLAKFVAEMKEREEKEMLRIERESEERIKEVKRKTEEVQAEHEEKHKQELAIVDAELERIYAERKALLAKTIAESEIVLQEELATAKEQHEAAIHKAQEQQQARFEQFWAQCQQEEEFMKKKHEEKMDELTNQLKASEKENINREFEKVRCEKRLLEDKYRTLKEKYVRLKSEVRLSMERKRQAKLNRQLQQRDGTSTTEETTERSTDHSKPPPGRQHNRKPPQIEESIPENGSTTPKTIKRKPPVNKSPISLTTTSSITAESCPSSSVAAQDTPQPVPSKPKNVWYPSPLQRREGVMDADISSADDNHTSVSEDITGCSFSEHDQSLTKWDKRKALNKVSPSNPIDSLRKQLEKLEELEEQFPPSTHIDTYLRYPFTGPAGASSELEFYRHRLHLERESVRRAKQALAEQRVGLESRQLQLRHKQANSSLQQLQQEERELTDMEVSLHRTRALLGEKIIRLRYLEQSLERVTPPLTENHSPTNTLSEPLGATDSSGFSGSDLDLSSTGVRGLRTERFWTDASFNVLQSLENINSEIREIWAILGKQQIPGTGLGPPPLLQYSDMGRALQPSDVSQRYHIAPRRATDIAERTRGLKEWLMQARDHHTPEKQVTL